MLEVLPSANNILLCSNTSPCKPKNKKIKTASMQVNIDRKTFQPNS